MRPQAYGHHWTPQTEFPARHSSGVKPASATEIWKRGGPEEVAPRPSTGLGTWLTPDGCQQEGQGHNEHNDGDNNEEGDPFGAGPPFLLHDCPSIGWME
jgi:hypothetical protein